MLSSDEQEKLEAAIMSGEKASLRAYRGYFLKSGIPSEHRISVWLAFLSDGQEDALAEEFARSRTGKQQGKSGVEKLRYEIEEVIHDSAMQAKCLDAVAFLAARHGIVKHTQALCRLCLPISTLRKSTEVPPSAEEIMVLLNALICKFTLHVMNPEQLQLHDQFFSILLRYHLPNISIAIDGKKLGLAPAIGSWINELFMPVIVDTTVTLHLWDAIITCENPTLLPLLALAFLVLHVDDLIANMESNEDFLLALKSLKMVDTVESILETVERLRRSTPTTLRRSIAEFRMGTLSERSQRLISQMIFAPVAAREVAGAKKGDQSVASDLHFIVLDCRPKSTFERGHVPRAIHVDVGSILAGAEKDEQILTLLENNQDMHIAFSGDGEGGEVDQLIHIISLRMLQHGRKYISIIYGGYREAHRESRHGRVHLANHLSEECPLCTSGEDTVLGEWELESPKAGSGIFRSVNKANLKDNLGRFQGSLKGTLKGFGLGVGEIKHGEGSKGKKKGQKDESKGRLSLLSKQRWFSGGGTEWSSISSWMNHKDISVFPTQLFREGGDLARCFVVVTNKNFLCLLCKPGNPQLCKSIPMVKMKTPELIRSRYAVFYPPTNYHYENRGKVVEKYTMPNNLVVRTIKVNIDKLKASPEEVEGNISKSSDTAAPVTKDGLAGAIPEPNVNEEVASVDQEKELDGDGDQRSAETTQESAVTDPEEEKELHQKVVSASAPMQEKESAGSSSGFGIDEASPTEEFAIEDASGDGGNDMDNFTLE